LIKVPPDRKKCTYTKDLVTIINSRVYG